MFGLFKKKEKISIATANSFIVEEDKEKKALCANDFFTPTYVFLDMKLGQEDREFYVKNNFFNLRCTLGTEASWSKNKAIYYKAIKEALQFSYEIVDEESYDKVFAEFIEPEPHAWNLVRMAGVIKDAYTVQYISGVKAKEHIGIIGTKLTGAYRSWEAVATDFLVGKLNFNHDTQKEGGEVEVFTDVGTILVMMDFLFNDKDSPFKKCLFDANENLHESSNHIYEVLLKNTIGVPQRARNMMKVYREAYDWNPFVLVDDEKLEERDRKTYEFVEQELKLDAGEEIIYVHSFTVKNPEKSSVEIILTNKNLITFLNKKARKNGEYEKITLKGINTSDLKLKEVEFGESLFYQDKKIVENISVGSSSALPAYLEILTDMINFLVQVQK